MSSNRFQFDLHAICASPLARRIYQALVVGLAVFILTLVALREPFRGYLAEVRISGPAMEGLDLNAAGTWLKQADRGVAVATSRSSDSAGRGQIRATFVAPRASAATPSSTPISSPRTRKSSAAGSCRASRGSAFASYLLGFRTVNRLDASSRERAKIAHKLATDARFAAIPADWSDFGWHSAGSTRRKEIS